jgi:hypothetical protein
MTFLLLNACGGGIRGDVGKACMAAGRSAANPALCSCVQQAANTHLNGSDQRRAATFFADPQLAQDTRQSDNPQLESFWTRYRAFSAAAERSCR